MAEIKEQPKTEAIPVKKSKYNFPHTLIKANGEVEIVGGEDIKYGRIKPKGGNE